MRIGWSLGGRTVAAMLALYPGSSAARIFYGPGDGLPAAAWSDPRSPLAQLPPGCTVLVSHKDQGVDSLAFVSAWLTHRPDVDLVLIAHHEPEQQKGGDPTPTQFRASWTRQRQQVGAHPARAAGRLRLAVCYTLQWIRRGGDWRIWWPEHEADAVDLVLVDWYPFMAGEPDPWKPRVYEDPASALRVPIDIARQVGKDWGIAEIDHPRILRAAGFSVDLDPDGTLAASWYRAMYAAARAAGCRVWAHFHANAGAALGDLTKRPAEQAVLRELIAQEAAMARVKTLGGHPIEQYSSPNVGGLMTGHRGPVLHIAEGTYRGTISWQMNPDQRYQDGTKVTTASSWVVGRDWGEWAQMCDSDRIAWCQRSGSRTRSSIELAGHAPDGPTPWQIEACAQILALEHRMYGVPIAVAGDPSEDGLGHHSMDREWLGEEWGHDSCPGTGVISAKRAIVARATQIINGGNEDMPLTAEDVAKVAQAAASAVHGQKIGNRSYTIGQALDRAYNYQGSIDALVSGVKGLGEIVARESSSPDEIRALLAELPQPAPVDPVDEQQIVQGVLAGLAGLDLDAAAAALRATFGDRAADLGALLQR